MLVTYFDPSDDGRPVVVALLRHIGESLRARKQHRAHLHRIGKSTAVIDANISALREVVRQIEALRRRRIPRIARRTEPQLHSF